MNKILPVWKSKGLTSFDIIRIIKKESRNIKIGHCGTLDPFAEGIVIYCTGNKTKNIDSLMDYKKEYIATIKFGAETDTLDLTGGIIKKNNPKIDKKALIDTLSFFKGETMQIPPYYSALKFHGIRLYDFARKGIFIRKKARSIHIESINLVSYNNNIAEISIKCSKGTYIRSLARDIAYRLNTYGYLEKLIRTSIGPYNKDNSIQLSNLYSCLN